MKYDENTDESLCDTCKHLLYFKHEREVSLSCINGHEPRYYPAVVECEDYEKR